MFAYQYPTDFWGGTGGDGDTINDPDGGGGGDGIILCTPELAAAGKCEMLDEIELPEDPTGDPDDIWDGNDTPIGDYTDGTPTDETTDDSPGGGGTTDNDTVDVGVIVIVNDTNDSANDCKEGQILVDDKCVYITKDTPCTQKGYVRNADLECVPDQVDNNLTDTCAKAIFTELENGLYMDHPIKPEVQISRLDTLNFSESILQIFTDSKKFNYTIINGSTNGSNASTDFPIYNSQNNTYNIITTINDNYLLNATKLSIARTMIHESVHGYLIYQQRGNPDRSLYNSLKKYGEDNGYSTSGANRLHHEFMSQYVDAMAYSLYEWDRKYGSGGNLGWSYYKSMGYGGLYFEDSSGNITETDSFKSLVPDSQKRLNIRNIILAEQNGNNDAKGTKCN